MQVSDTESVQHMYDDSAQGYSSMMDEEIKQPIYHKMLTSLSTAIEGLSGPVVDTSCGSGHMLYMYRQQIDAQRPLIGTDLSPEMVKISQQRLGAAIEVHTADMCRLPFLLDNSCAGVISFFAIHHLNPKGVKDAFQEWRRILISGGQLLLAAWEGEGAIDYGSFSDIQALNHSSKELIKWLAKAGFNVSICDAVTVEEMAMEAVYIQASLT
jgi:ubiquinone/menaquinone biosynthesis C-methylase UbiE